MSDTAPSLTSASSQEGRASASSLFDELDDLLQRMLELPVRDQEEGLAALEAASAPSEENASPAPAPQTSGTAPLPPVSVSYEVSLPKPESKAEPEPEPKPQLEREPIRPESLPTILFSPLTPETTSPLEPRKESPPVSRAAPPVEPPPSTEPASAAESVEEQKHFPVPKSNSPASAPVSAPPILPEFPAPRPVSPPATSEQLKPEIPPRAVEAQDSSPKQTDKPLLLYPPPSYPFWMWPFTWSNSIFDFFARRLGPIGTFLQQPMGRLGLGITGLICLVIAVGMLLSDWMGWTW